MGMQTARAVQIGLGQRLASTPGSSAHDTFALEASEIVRGSNRAGGVEGGMSNGEPIVARVSVKPIPTLMRALPSVNLHAGEAAPAAIVRSDVCVVPAAAIVGEAMVPRFDGADPREVRRRLVGGNARQSRAQPRIRAAPLR